jgi:hypothetical protein
MNMGLIDEPLEFLLYSDFSVMLAYGPSLHAVHGGADLQLDDAHRPLADRGGAGRGASGWQILWNVIMPLCKPGIAIGSIFVVTLVMGDFVTTRMMSAARAPRSALMISNADVAAAVSRRRRQRRDPAHHRAGPDRRDPAVRRHPQGALRCQRERRGPGFYAPRAFFCAVRAVPLRPDARRS